MVRLQQVAIKEEKTIQTLFQDKKLRSRALQVSSGSSKPAQVSEEEWSGGGGLVGAWLRSVAPAVVAGSENEGSEGMKKAGVEELTSVLTDGVQRGNVLKVLDFSKKNVFFAYADARMAER